MKRTLIAMLCVILMAACGDSSGPSSDWTEGQWTGVAAGSTFNFTLSEDDGDIAGIGVLTSPSQSAAIEVVGDRVGPNINIRFDPQGFSSFTFAGVLESSSRMSGRINGSGMNNLSVTFMKS